MKLELIAFTQRGNALAEQLAKTLSDHGHQAAYTRDGLKAEAWAERAFSRSEGLIFVGATGIAVRSIAPHLRHKSTDPAVIVVDEGGQFVIPILSGHLGGANDLAREIATLIGAVPVITTATDVNGVFAVDQWARRQGLMVCNLMVAAQDDGAVGLLRDMLPAHHLVRKQQPIQRLEKPQQKTPEFHSHAFSPLM